MSSRILFCVLLALAGITGQVSAQLLNGSFSQGGSYWNWLSADTSNFYNCESFLSPSSERVWAGVAYGHSGTGYITSFRKTCGSIRQTMTVPLASQLRYDRKLGEILGLGQVASRSNRVSLKTRMITSQSSFLLLQEKGRDQDYNCTPTFNCPEFETRTISVPPELWGQAVTLEFVAEAEYLKNSLGMLVEKPSQAFIDNVQFEPVPANRWASPTAGLWYNPDRQGGGINITRNNAGDLLLAWYTYLPNGTPVWFMSDVEPMIDGTWVSALRKGNRDPVSGNVVWQLVGTAELTMLANNELIFTWDLNAQSGSQSVGAEKMFHLAGGDSFTGLYFEPAFPGWGVNLDVQGSGSTATNVATVYFYTPSGQPIWAQGVESGDLNQSVTFSMQTFNGLCPGCVGQPPSSTGTSAGTLNMQDFATSSNYPKGYSNIQTGGGITWMRGSSSNLITYARLSKP